MRFPLTSAHARATLRAGAVAALVIAAGVSAHGLRGAPAMVQADPVVLAVAPVVDGASGKIVDRVDGRGPDEAPARLALSSLVQFAAGLDLGTVSDDLGSSPVAVAALEAAPAKAAPQRAKIVVAAVPLPPQRPVAPQAVAVLAEKPSETPAEEGLLSRVIPAGIQPARLLPAGQQAWSKVASLGEALVDRLIP